MLRVGDTLALSFDALRAHRLRTALTILGLTIGVTTLITVVTIIQGANAYVETKVAGLGSDVFQLARTPFAVTDFQIVLRALRYKHVTIDDYRAIAGQCWECAITGASGTAQVRARFRDVEVQDVNLTGQTTSMERIDTREIERGRFFTEVESQRAARVCLIGSTLQERFFAG